MFEAEIGGVQRHAANLTFVDHRRLSQWAAVFDVATDGMTKLRQVDSDLVGTTRFQSAFQFAVVANFLQGSKMSDGSFALRGIGGAAAQPVTSIARQV